MSTTLRITLPDDLYTHFEAAAFMSGQPIEDHLIAHLTSTRDYTGGEDAIHLQPEHAKEVRRMFGARVNTPERLLNMIGRLSGMKVAGARVDISPERQEALNWYARSMQRPLDEAIPIAIDQALGLLLKC